jgi:hypothetical protein
MTVRAILPAVTVIPMLLFWGSGSCQPTGGSTGGKGGNGGNGGSKGETGGILGSGGRGSGGSSAGSGGSVGQSGGSSAGSLGNGGSGGQLAAGGSGGQLAAGGAGAGGRGGTIGNGGSTVSAGHGGGGGDAGSSTGQVDAGPVACDDTQSSGRLGIYYYDDGAVTGQAVQMHFDAVNYTAFGSRLSQVTIRYWFTDEVATTPNVVEQYYVPIPTKMKFSAVNPPRAGADTVLEISFSDQPDAGISWVESKGFNFAFHKDGYSGTYDQSNDYSYDAKLTKALGPNPKITAYVNGALAWGCEPPIQSATIDASAGSPAVDAPASAPSSVDGGR